MAGFLLPGDVVGAAKRAAARVDAVEQRHRPRFARIAAEASREVRERLATLEPGRYTANSQAAILVQVAAVAGRFSRDTLGELRAQGEEAAQVGREGLAAQVKAWEPYFEGISRRVVRTEEAAAFLDSALLRYYERSATRYGLKMIGRVEDTLALSALQGETVIQASERISKAFDLDQGWAERIARTETSRAAHRSQLAELRDTLGDDADHWRKQLIATIDRRTGPDSIFVNGQIRKPDEDFEDNEGRVYPHPPNRPNDRETMILVPGPPSKVNPRVAQVDEEEAAKRAAAPEAPPPHAAEAERLRRAAAERAAARAARLAEATPPPRVIIGAADVQPAATLVDLEALRANLAAAADGALADGAAARLGATYTPPVEVQAAVRRELQAACDEMGLHAGPSHKARAAAFSTVTEHPAWGSMRSDGAMTMDLDQTAQAAEWVGKVRAARATGERYATPKGEQKGIRGLKCMIHEEVHARGPFTLAQYHKRELGYILEEATTELTARRMMLQRFPELAPNEFDWTPLNAAQARHLGMDAAKVRLRSGSYHEEIHALVEVVRANAPTPLTWREAREVTTDAAIRFKRGEGFHHGKIAVRDAFTDALGAAGNGWADPERVKKLKRELSKVNQQGAHNRFHLLEAEDRR